MNKTKAIEKIKRIYGNDVKITELKEPSNYYPSGYGHSNAMKKLEKEYKTGRVINNRMLKIISIHNENNYFHWFFIKYIYIRK